MRLSYPVKTHTHTSLTENSVLDIHIFKEVLSFEKLILGIVAIQLEFLFSFFYVNLCINISITLLLGKNFTNF